MSDDTQQGMLPGFDPPRRSAPSTAPPPIIKEKTPEQAAIIEYVRSGTEHVLVQALAGTGKTSTILDSLASTTVKRVLLCAFGNANAATLEAKMPKVPRGRVWRAKTLHALGVGVLYSHGWKPEATDENGGFHKDATEDLVNDTADAIAEAVAADKRSERPLWFDLPFSATKGTEKAMISDEIRRAARDLVYYWKDRFRPHAEVTVEDEDEDTADEALDAFADLDEEDEALAREIAHCAYVMGARIDRPKIDFRDQVWLPLVLDLTPKWPFDLVIVDEGQDLSRPQFELAKRFVAPGGRLVIVGDLHQGIYAWRGAIGHEVWKEMGAMNAVTLPLTVSFRCARTIVEAANSLVPDLRACEGAPIGKVYTCPLARMIEGLQGTTINSFVLSRNNALLFKVAIQLWRKNALFSFSKGEELAEGLHALVNQLDLVDVPRFQKSLDAWHDNAIAKAQEKSAISRIDRIKQRRDTLLALLQCTEPRGLHALLKRLTSSRDAIVKLSTVHGAKGLEADRVYLLRQTFARYKEGAATAEIPPEELNLEYVAITRARHELVWVDVEGSDG